VRSGWPAGICTCAILADYRKARPPALALAECLNWPREGVDKGGQSQAPRASTNNRQPEPSTSISQTANAHWRGEGVSSADAGSRWNACCTPSVAAFRSHPIIDRWMNAAQPHRPAPVRGIPRTYLLHLPPAGDGDGRGRTAADVVGLVGRSS
jgi:hypothetical protein